MQQQNVPGKGLAIGALVCGIIACVCGCGAVLMFTPVVGVICGVVGIILAANAKKQGFSGGMQTAGFVLSLIGLILCAVTFFTCTICTGCAACAGGVGALF